MTKGHLCPRPKTFTLRKAARRFMFFPCAPSWQGGGPSLRDQPPQGVQDCRSAKRKDPPLLPKRRMSKWRTWACALLMAPFLGATKGTRTGTPPCWGSTMLFLLFHFPMRGITAIKEGGARSFAGPVGIWGKVWVLTTGQPCFQRLPTPPPKQKIQSAFV